LDDFHRKAYKERKAGALFEAVFMHRKWISHLRLSAFICGSIFLKQFIDTEITAPRIKYHEQNKYWVQRKRMSYILNPVESLAVAPPLHIEKPL